MVKIINSSRCSIVLSIIVGMLSGCSSTSDKASKDDFFEPVDKIIVKQSESSATPQFLTRERYGLKTDESMKDAIIEMLRMQNRRLEDVVVQLSQLTKREIADNSSYGNIEATLSSREKVTSQLLMEMIQNQNQRLNDVIEQLKVLAQNQQMLKGTQSSLVARVNASPIENPPTRKVTPVKKSDAFITYAKAIHLYQNKQYDEAIIAFKNLINRGIEQKLADNCHFWLGVSYFNQRKFNQAISAFKEVFNYNDSDKAESSYFMIAQCYEQMGAVKFAKITFEKLLNDYPNGALKQISEKKIALLK